MKSYNDKTPGMQFPRDHGAGALTDENSSEERRIYGNYQNADMNMKSSMDEEAVENKMSEQEPAAADAPYEEDMYNKDGNHVEGFGMMHDNMRSAAMGSSNKSFAGGEWDAASAQHTPTHKD